MEKNLPLTLASSTANVAVERSTPNPIHDFCQLDDTCPAEVLRELMRHPLTSEDIQSIIYPRCKFFFEVVRKLRYRGLEIPRVRTLVKRYGSKPRYVGLYTLTPQDRARVRATVVKYWGIEDV